MTTVWSYDDGYGDNKLYDGKRELLIPSYITRWRPKMKQEIEKGTTVDPYDYITIELEEPVEITENGKTVVVNQTVKYLVGLGAIRQDTSGSAVLGDNKHKDKRFKYLMMTCLGLLAEKEDTFVDLLSMGLPVKAEEDPERHELLKSIIVDKPMKFTLTLADGTVLNRNISVRELMIKKQPFGSHADIFLDEEGEIVDDLESQTIAEAFVGIADIGARTYNYYTLDDLDPVKDLSDNTNDGMFVAYEEINEAIQELTGSKLPDAQLPYIINTRKTINNHDLRAITAEAYDNLANKIVQIIEKTYINSWARLMVIIFTGGGSELLRPYLTEYMQNRPIRFLDRFATARGLRKLAVREMNRRKKLETPQRKRAAAKNEGNEVTA